MSLLLLELAWHQIAFMVIPVFGKLESNKNDWELKMIIYSGLIQLFILLISHHSNLQIIYATEQKNVIPGLEFLYLVLIEVSLIRSYGENRSKKVHTQ